MLRIPLLALALLAALIACETPLEPPAEIPPCTPIDGATVDPCKPGAGTITVEGATFLYLGPRPIPLAHHIDDGRSPGTVAHLVVRGTYVPGTSRCATVPRFFRAPSYWTEEEKRSMAFFRWYTVRCFVDVRANAYLLGAGPSTLTVDVLYEFYGSTPESQQEGERIRAALERLLVKGGTFREGVNVTQVPAGGIGGREAILFIGPGRDLNVESWRVWYTWDVERRADDVIIAVPPWRDGYAGDPETFAPVRDKMEIPLPTFAEQVQAIHLARMTANGGRIGPEANLPMLRTNADQLRAYYTDVGAYAPGVDPPAQPPPVAATPSSSPPP